MMMRDENGDYDPFPLRTHSAAYVFVVEFSFPRKANNKKKLDMEKGNVMLDNTQQAAGVRKIVRLMSEG